MRLKLVVSLCALLAILLAAPGTALAAKKRKPKPVMRTLTGQVVGTPLPAGTRNAVPVLLHARSARRAKLRSPLALVRVPRNARVLVPGRKRVGLSALRVGDAFRVRLAVPRAARRAVYPALNARAAAFRITRRGTAASPAELQEQLWALSGYVQALTGYVLAQFADLRGQVAGLRGDLGTLQRGLDQLRARVDALPAGLESQIMALIARADTLDTQMQTVTTQLATVTGDLSTVAQKLTGISPGDLAGALSDVATLQALVAGIDVAALSTSVTNLTSAVASGDANLQSQIDTANAALAAAQRQLAFLCSAGLVTGPLVDLQMLGPCPA